MCTLFLRTLFFLNCIGSLSLTANSQLCSGGSSPITMTYDTVAYGNGNASRTFTFPKFDPSLGTLVSVDIASNMGLSYSYVLQNQTASSNLFRIRIVRTDDITSTYLDPESINNLRQTPYYNATIAAGDFLNYGPGYLQYGLTYTVDDGRLTNYLGVGSVYFDYETGTSATVSGPLPWQLNFTSVVDTTNFSITYNYCPTVFLSAPLTGFTVNRQKDQQVHLSWQQPVENAARKYVVEASTDARIYQPIKTIAANNNGSYQFKYHETRNQLLFYRVRQVEVNGVNRISPIRTIEALTPEQMVQVNSPVSTASNIVFSVNEIADWQVLLYNSNTKMVANMQYNNTNRLQLAAGQPAGLYYAKLVNLKTKQVYTQKILITP